ncbi:glycoside hydrolase family 35 protein [Cadophora sp. DSE1049]|nr:glycoside hydrolase family 35 protein [Cadophora sp. DSE1049]
MSGRYTMSNLCFRKLLCSYLSTFKLGRYEIDTIGNADQWPIHDNGLNKVVQWDHYSVIVNGERLFIWSGELHLWRIPVPELWADILQKLKAAGFNGIGLYEHWGWHAPNNETLDFETGAHHYAPIFDMAQELGLYIVYRPGPYSNAEANGGGFPGWLTTGEYGPLRDDDPRYSAVWERYSHKIAEYVKPYLITNGGPVIFWQIENEYGAQFLDPELRTPNQSAINYIIELHDEHRDWHIDVPFTANNPNLWTRSWSKDWSNVGGELDLYGLDHYPAFAKTQPSFLMEFQGGSYNPWDGPIGGCADRMGPEWVNIFYRHNLAQKVSAVNIYMAYSETKQFGLFMRVARDFTKVNRIGNSTDYTTDNEIYATELRNPDTNGAFYVTRHEYSPSKNNTQFRLHISTSIGNLTVPANNAIRLNGIASKTLLIYATAEILTVSDLLDRQVVVLWAPMGEFGEFLLQGATKGSVVQGNSKSVKFASKQAGLTVSFTVGKDPLVIQLNNGVQAVIVDRGTAYGFWQPTLNSNYLAWENATVLVRGPYLVRGASIKSKTLELTGDWDKKTDVEIWAPKSVEKVEFNGKSLSVKKTGSGSLIGTLESSKHTIQTIQADLPKLKWKVADGLPEVDPKYDDSRWTAANHMTTTAFSLPDTLPVLYADEYGYQAGNLLWRARFNTISDPVTAVYLRLVGGLGAGWSAYLNGKFVGAWAGDMTTKTPSLTLPFNNATLNPTGENVLFIIQDTTGKGQREEAIDPRGILNATLITKSGQKANFTSWKLAGNAGGNHRIDPIRGTYNEGGLHAERLGWHLPVFKDKSWTSGNPSDGFTGVTAKFYRTTLDLNLPKGHDISLAFELRAPPKAKLRAQLYVNGYNYARIIPYFGNQIEFPVPPGILDYKGENTIGLSIWSQDEVGGKVDVSLKVLGVHETAYNVFFNSKYLRPGWTDRSKYA